MKTHIWTANAHTANVMPNPRTNPLGIFCPTVLLPRVRYTQCCHDFGTPAATRFCNRAAATVPEHSGATTSILLLPAAPSSGDVGIFAGANIRRGLYKRGAD